MKFTPGKIAFGRSVVETPGQPSPHKRKSDEKRLLCLKSAEQVLDCIPAPGEQVHALMTGFYDLMHLIVVLLEKVGHCGHLRIATLSYNGKNLAEMIRLLDSGHIGRISLATSCFFRDHNTELWEETLEEFGERQARANASRSHAKVVTLDTPAGYFVFEGSANLRTNRNREQICILNCQPLHNWHAEWIDQIVAATEAVA